ncbi:hypothetical protein [Psychroflexus sp. ALD_RP9]|uniref:hypothetical protein n=1 Tax=Psychroflexus sp. ALD_RP9 TaxID=2777186 RepID=UPI001A8DC75B|nr:hypothetical protein [Psychroflexus sp. ALD_RP9]QSS96702.1 hypothetical protein IMZ30_09635 [Psychroflexus sp. ALD_RP9]
MVPKIPKAAVKLVWGISLKTRIDARLATKVIPKILRLYTPIPLFILVNKRMNEINMIPANM